MPPHKLCVELSYTARHSRPPAAPRQVQTTPRTDGEEAGLPGPEEGLGTAASSVPGRRLPGGLTTGSKPSPHQRGRATTKGGLRVHEQEGALTQATRTLRSAEEAVHTRGPTPSGRAQKGVCSLAPEGRRSGPRVTASG